MRLSEILSELREDRGLTQLEVSRQLHISNSSLSAYETGMRTPHAETLKAFAAFYDVTTDYLLGLTSDSISASVLSEEFIDGVEMSSVLNTLRSLTHEQRTAMLLILENMKFYTDVAIKAAPGSANRK